MKKLFILDSSPDITSLCTSMLEEENFHSSLTVVESNKSKKTYSGWEVTLEQLTTLHRAIRDKGISLKDFRVAMCRTTTRETLRMAQKEEYIPGYQSQNNRPERLRKTLAKRK